MQTIDHFPEWLPFASLKTGRTDAQNSGKSSGPQLKILGRSNSNPVTPPWNLM
jgi:hypothetical protein